MHVQFAELPVFDQDRAIKFYTDNLGCAVVADAPMGKDGWRWVEIGFGGSPTALHFVRRDDDALSAEPVLVFVDDDVRATVERLRVGGAEIITGPHEAPWQPGRIAAEFRDSEGNLSTKTKPDSRGSSPAMTAESWGVVISLNRPPQIQRQRKFRVRRLLHKVE